MRVGRGPTPGTPPYIIAEVGANHNGDMDLARELIREAYRAGCDCVKFQSWTAGTIFSRQVYEDNYFLGDDYRGSRGLDLKGTVEKFSLSPDQLAALAGYCREVGIDFASTPFSRAEVDHLVGPLGAGFVKVASMDLTNIPLLVYVAGKGLPVVLSTGMGTVREVDQAVRAIERAGNREITLLHCVSSYPPADKDVNLRNMDMLRDRYAPLAVGFSDHTLGTAIPLAAAARGATVIEKHFTLDKDMPGWDHKVSATPGEMRELVTGARRVSAALGSYTRRVSRDEQDKVTAFRRSIVAARDIPAGKEITAGDLDAKRPGTGICPRHTGAVIGKKAARPILYDEIIKWGDIS